MLVRIRKIHVLSVERPSNEPMPFSTPTHASWTTSSATARLPTYRRATLSIDAPCSRTSLVNVASSPARRASITEVSTGCTQETVTNAARRGQSTSSGDSTDEGGPMSAKHYDLIVIGAG